MSEEFCVVTRKKWLARKSLQRRPRRVSDKNYDDCPDVDVEKFMKRLDHLCEQMRVSDYFTQAMSTLTESLHALGIEDVTKLDHLVCLGIGPFTRNYQALHQLAFILNAQRHCNITEAVYFDPVFRESEKEILTRLHCTLMTKNCEAKYAAEKFTLFYMPHCPNGLTNNLLWCNWQPERLSNLVLINNSFDSLVCSKPERLLRLDADYILNILDYATELPLEDDYETHNVFNDLSVHVFPMKTLPDKESEFWTQKEAPKYKDIEMISAEEFEKLSIA